MTKNLNDNEIQIIAGAMQARKFEKGDLIIKYGDQGQLYYILSNGSVRVTVYETGTDPNDANIH